jgi:hypothetical protein
MRITNNMIMGNTKTNINSTKVLVDKYNADKPITANNDHYFIRRISLWHT